MLNENSVNTILRTEKRPHRNGTAFSQIGRGKIKKTRGKKGRQAKIRKTPDVLYYIILFLIVKKK